VRKLQARPGRELQVHGSAQLLRWLLERDLVDELSLRIFPSWWAMGFGSSRSAARRMP
jgi:riboflavin biosynthesis pyrimidine reductase